MPVFNYDPKKDSNMVAMEKMIKPQRQVMNIETEMPSGKKLLSQNSIHSKNNHH
jgi:hypothetical protein